MTKILFCIVLCLLYSKQGSGQGKDYKARLKVNGGIDKISVLPDGSLWLGTRTGELYYTSDFDQPWHYKFRDISLISRDQYLQVVGLNKEILVIGQISNSERYNPDAVLRSANGGRDWEKISFTETATTQIHAIDYNDKGEVWISGGPARFYYSNDFGKTWNERTMPYQGSSRVYAIDMVSSSSGYVCTQAGKISRTDDNGLSWKPIQTPYQQGLFEVPEKNWVHTSVKRIAVSNGKLITKQGDHVYYSDSANIQWKPFSEKLIHFAVDRRTGKLWGLNEAGEILRYGNNLTLEKKINNLLIRDAIDIEAMGNTLFAIDRLNQVYRVKEAVEMRGLYTEDHPIENPDVQKKATAVKWGATGNHIYNSTYNNFEWYRIKVVDFSIADLKLLNDNEAILWDGHSKSYYYNRDKDSLSVVMESHPLQDFLAHKIEKITITAGSAGCFHSNISSVSYKLKSRGEFVIDAETTVPSVGSRFERTVQYATVLDILSNIDRNPHQSVSIHDFRISDRDIDACRKKIARTGKLMRRDLTATDIHFDHQYFENAVAHIDTIGVETINQWLEDKSDFWSTTSNWFTVIFTNSKDEELLFEHHYYVGPKPWFLPWHVKSGNTNFISKNISFSRLINEMIPERFMFKEAFNNSELIYGLIENNYKRGSLEVKGR